MTYYNMTVVVLQSPNWTAVGASVPENKTRLLGRRVCYQLAALQRRSFALHGAVTESVPNLLWINNGVGARELLHGETGVQINTDLLICFIYQLAAVEGILIFRV